LRSPSLTVFPPNVVTVKSGAICPTFGAACTSPAIRQADSAPTPARYRPIRPPAFRTPRGELPPYRAGCLPERPYGRRELIHHRLRGRPGAHEPDATVDETVDEPSRGPEPLEG